MLDLRARAATGLASLVALLALAAVAVFILSERRLERRYDVQPEDLAVRDDPASIARGRHLAIAIGQCAHCHGDDLGGKRVADEPGLGRLHAPNITVGEGGVGASYTNADFVRAIRHGLSPDELPLLVMPAHYFQHFSNSELAALIAYLRSVPPTDRATPMRKIGALTRLALVIGRAPGLLSAEQVDHARRRRPEHLPEVSADYGGFLVEVAACKMCHHENLTGGLHPLSTSDEPTPPNLTPGGPLGQWSHADFTRALRSGVTPDGRRLDHRFMPWPYIGQMTDSEIGAIWLYLVSLDTNRSRRAYP